MKHNVLFTLAKQFSKQYYDNRFCNKTKREKLIDCIFLLVYCTICTGILICNFNIYRPHLSSYSSGGIYIMVWLYFYHIKMKLVQQEKKGIKYISDHAKKVYERFKAAIVWFTFFVWSFIAILLYCNSLHIDFDSAMLNYLYYFVFILTIGWILMNFNFIVWFTADGYYSKLDYISFDSITKIECYKEKNTSDGVVYCSNIIFHDTIIGFDKFFADEFCYIRRNIES